MKGPGALGHTISSVASRNSGCADSRQRPDQKWFVDATSPGLARILTTIGAKVSGPFRGPTYRQGSKARLRRRSKGASKESRLLLDEHLLTTPCAAFTRPSSWCDPPIRHAPGAFVVNLGDMLAAWTRHQYTATPHRVLQAHRGRYRTSVAYFFEPNFDAVIRPLHTAPGDELPSQPPPSTEPLSRAASGGSLIYGEHLFAKVSGNFCLAE